MSRTIFSSDSFERVWKFRKCNEFPPSFIRDLFRHCLQLQFKAHSSIFQFCLPFFLFTPTLWLSYLRQGMCSSDEQKTGEKVLKKMVVVLRHIVLGENRLPHCLTLPTNIHCIRIALILEDYWCLALEHFPKTFFLFYSWLHWIECCRGRMHGNSFNFTLFGRGERLLHPLKW